MNLWAQRTAFSFFSFVVGVGTVIGWSQAPAGPPSVSGLPVGVFETTADFEQSNVDRGASLGVATPPEGANSSNKTSNERKGEFAAAPIPMVNPTIGNGAGAVALYATRIGKDDRSPASSFASAGFATESGSWALGLGAKLYLRDDKYRVLVGGGGGTFNYDFFGIGWPEAGWDCDFCLQNGTTSI